MSSEKLQLNNRGVNILYIRNSACEMNQHSNEATKVEKSVKV